MVAEGNDIGPSLCRDTHHDVVDNDAVIRMPFTSHAQNINQRRPPIWLEGWWRGCQESARIVDKNEVLIRRRRDELQFGQQWAVILSAKIAATRMGVDPEECRSFEIRHHSRKNIRGITQKESDRGKMAIVLYGFPAECFVDLDRHDGRKYFCGPCCPIAKIGSSFDKLADTEFSAPAPLSDLKAGLRK